MHIHLYTVIYLAGRGRLERHGVNSLDATPFLVRNIHSTEKLEGSVGIRHNVQPPQGRLEVFTAQLAVGAVGRREAETGYPIRVIIDDKMDNLLRQEQQQGQSGDEGGLRQSTSSMPCKVLHGQAQVSERRLFAHIGPSLYKVQGDGPWGLSAGPNAAAETVCHAPRSLLLLMAVPVPRRHQYVLGVCRFRRFCGFRSAPLVPARSWDKDVTVRTRPVLQDMCTYMRILTGYLQIHTHTYTYRPWSSRTCAMRSQADSLSSAFMTLMPAVAGLRFVRLPFRFTPLWRSSVT